MRHGERRKVVAQESSRRVACSARPAEMSEEGGAGERCIRAKKYAFKQVPLLFHFTQRRTRRGVATRMSAQPRNCRAAMLLVVLVKRAGWTVTVMRTCSSVAHGMLARHVPHVLSRTEDVDGNAARPSRHVPAQATHECAPASNASGNVV